MLRTNDQKLINMKNKPLYSLFIMHYSRRAFTLIELVVALGILVLLIASAVFIIDPARQLAKSRNNEREAHLNLFITAVGQNMFDNRGAFSCSSGEIPSSTARMASSADNYNIGPCLVPTYLQALPFDPSTSSATYVDENDYDTGYFILRNATTGRVTVSAPAAELEETIEITR